MASQLLTARGVETARARDKEYLTADGNNLYLRIRPDGGKGWLCIYTSPTTGKRRKAGLGEYPAVSLSRARELAAGMNTKIAAGIDPIDEKIAAKATAMAMVGKTLDALLTAYVKHLRAQGKSSADDVESVLRLHVPADTRSKPARDVTKADLLPAVRRLVDDGKVRTAAKLRSNLHAAFEAAMRADDSPSAPADMLGFNIEANPVTRIASVEGGRGNAGQRALTRAEFITYVERLDALPPGDIKDLLLLQVFAGGQRVAQLLAASLSDDGIELVILDRKGRRSTPRVHRVPLIGRAAEIVAARGNQLFGLSDPADIKAAQLAASDAVKKIGAATAGAPFGMGDIRRSVETLLAGAGVSMEHRAQLLSHGIAGVQAQHYDRHSYHDEKVAALRKLHRLLTTTAPDAGQVIAIRGAA